jgi:hypothetical protein
LGYRHAVPPGQRQADEKSVWAAEVECEVVENFARIEEYLEEV